LGPERDMMFISLLQLVLQVAFASALLNAELRGKKCKIQEKIGGDLRIDVEPIRTHGLSGMPWLYEHRASPFLVIHRALPRSPHN